MAKEMLWPMRLLKRLRDGTMPCDEAWPPEQVATFQRWIAAGRRPDCTAGRRQWCVRPNPVEVPHG